MAKKSFAVIGLGQFGTSIVEQLVENSMDVIAIDSNEEAVKKMGAILPTCFVADATDETALKELGIEDVDTAIVAMGNNKEVSVLSIVLLKELGVPHIIARCDSDFYVSIFKKLGANEVISPQKAAGQSLANRLGSEDYKDYYKLDAKNSIVSIEVNEFFEEKSLVQLNTNDKFGINIVLIKRANKSFIPSGRDKIHALDTVFVVGTAKAIKNFSDFINGVKRPRK